MFEHVPKTDLAYAAGHAGVCRLLLTYLKEEKPQADLLLTAYALRGRSRVAPTVEMLAQRIKIAWELKRLYEVEYPPI